MNILSLCDGKSSGYTAAELAGIKIDNFYSSEVDKYAIQVSNAIHPNQIRLGDVTKWREWNIDWSSIDLVIAGSPCQGFSFAGKQLAFDDPRSKLFFEFVDILNHIKSLNQSVKFMFENVKMKKEYLDVISRLLGVEPMFINSSLVSAQNRQRYYWFNLTVEQPKDREIYLWDIVEDDCNEGGVFAGAMRGRYIVEGNSRLTKQRIEMRYDGKSNALTTVRKDNNVVYGADGRNHYALEDIKYRSLTPRECFRLQTMPEHLIDKVLSCGVSNSQLYKIAGNGWTDEVIAHIFRGLL